jgi:hypothetical protein
VACELVIQLPFFFFAVEALLKRQLHAIRTAAIVYAAHVMTTVVPICVELWFAECVTDSACRLGLVCIFSLRCLLCGHAREKMVTALVGRASFNLPTAAYACTSLVFWTFAAVICLGSLELNIILLRLANTYEHAMGVNVTLVLGVSLGIPRETGRRPCKTERS